MTCGTNRLGRERQLISNLRTYVDSICAMNKVWKTLPDSFYAEVPLDSINMTWDTLVLNAKDKKEISILVTHICRKKIKQDYLNLVNQVDNNFNSLSNYEKKQFKRIRNKFEDLYLKPSDSLIQMKFDYLNNYDFYKFRELNR
ncbi:MAG: hypothetical protein NTU43_03270 [Bacteroidetes bacterium]|nr:hypothetical protein [Bacteroidota bacterium]